VAASSSGPDIAPLYIPPRLLAKRFAVPDSHRDRGIHMVAGSGSGTSLTLGLIAFLDFLRGVPQIVFDPTGQTIDAFLMYVTQFSRPMRRGMWPLVVYVDMAGRGAHVPAWPLLHAYPGDSLQDIADRFLQTCRAIDPNLASASIQGYNALYRVGAPAGIILSSLGLQLDQVLDLLDSPEAWSDRLARAVQAHPEAQAAVEFIRTSYVPLSVNDRLALSQSYRAKVEPILLDPSLTAMFCTAPGSVDFREVVQCRQTVLLDFRHETNETKRLLKTRWAFDSIMAFIRHRGPGRHRPLAIHFDEITELTNQASLEHELFTRDLDYLFNVVQRNYSCWITAAHQQMWQLSERTQQTLTSLGTQIVGVVSDINTAEALARQYAPLDPMLVKRMKPVWMKDKDDRPFVGAYEPVDFPMHEQTFVAAREFMRLKPFEFLVMPRHGTTMQRVSLAGFVGDPWPSEYGRLLAYIRHRLSQGLDSPGRLEGTAPAPSAVTDDLSGEPREPFVTMGHGPQDPLEQEYGSGVDDPDFWDTSGDGVDG
jgi:hypothetical protein